MYWKCQKVTFRCSGSYIDSSDGMKKRKKATISQNIENDKFFQNVVPLY